LIKHIGRHRPPRLINLRQGGLKAVEEKIKNQKSCKAIAANFDRQSGSEAFHSGGGGFDSCSGEGTAVIEAFGKDIKRRRKRDEGP
jgi:hypothetical protein